jgi:hypothetical protein
MPTVSEQIGRFVRIFGKWRQISEQRPGDKIRG